MNRAIVFTGGGTAGHVFPGLTVIRSVQQHWSGDIVWIGSVSGMERRIVTAAGVRYIGIPSGKLRRYFSIRNCIDIVKISAGCIAAWFLLRRLKAVAVFSKGGYVTVPVILAARLQKLYAATHESDFDPGLATKINARSVSHIFISFPQTKQFFSQNLRRKVLVSGNPVRKEIIEGRAERANKMFAVPPGKPLLFIMGGSQGARQINRLIEEIIEELTKRYIIIHQMGHLDYTPSRLPCYRTFDFIGDELPDILARADLIISRAGANSLWEYGVLKKPAVLIPLSGPASRGDQVRNAEAFSSRGAAVVLTGNEVNAASLLETVVTLMEDERRRVRMGEAAEGLCNRNAGEIIAETLLSNIRG
jgi:UDP-N-acetylglucosamine--N-acetylmuramyl-(pentapeptide) pyrophosphoryl-undecaprenol N-acetylglucosamine transferase